MIRITPLCMLNSNSHRPAISGRKIITLSSWNRPRIIIIRTTTSMWQIASIYRDTIPCWCSCIIPYINFYIMTIATIIMTIYYNIFIRACTNPSKCKICPHTWSCTTIFLYDPFCLIISLTRLPCS